MSYPYLRFTSILKFMVTLADLGERRAVQTLLRVFDRGHAPGLGDDSGILPWGDHYLLITTDVVNERTHFPIGTTPYDMGWYLVAVNLSDIAAMGGYPLGFIAALTLPKTTEITFLNEIARGMDSCTKHFGVAVYGGDTKEGEAISMAGVAIGRVLKNRILLRKGCREGDILAVTGEIGRGGWALQTIKKDGPSRETIEALLHPTPRLEQGLALSESGVVSSCIDNSDGLATTLYQLSASNGIGFDIEEHKLPIFSKIKDLPSATSLALYSGGDYELVVAIKSESFEELKTALIKKNVRLTDIGHVVKGKDCTLITGKGRELIQDRGWEHFKS